MKHRPSIFSVLVWTACCNLLTWYTSRHLVLKLIAKEQPEDSEYFMLALNVVEGLCYLLYPLMGILAEVYFTKYKMMLGGTYLQLGGTFFLTVTSSLFMQSSVNHAPIVVVIPYALIQVGLAMFQSNVIQFGTDQIRDRPSSELSSFVYWYFWASFIGHVLMSCLLLVLLTSTRSFMMSLKGTFVSACLLQIACFITILIIFHTNRIQNASSLEKYATRNEVLHLKHQELCNTLLQCIFMAPVSSLSRPIQEELMHWIFRNEDRVWRYRGGRDGHETLQQFMSFIGTKGREKSKLYPGVAMFIVSLSLQNEFTLDIDRDLGVSNNLIGYSVGEMVDPLDDTREDDGRMISRWQPKEPDCYEVVTSWVNPQ